jgi:hypothetical protein
MIGRVAHPPAAGPTTCWRVDASLHRAYRRIGFVSREPYARNLSYDSDAAIAAGVMVLRELTENGGY